MMQKIYVLINIYTNSYTIFIFFIIKELKKKILILIF